LSCPITRTQIPFAICNNGDIKGELNSTGGEGVDLKGELKEVSSLPFGQRRRMISTMMHTWKRYTFPNEGL